MVTHGRVWIIVLAAVLSDARAAHAQPAAPQAAILTGGFADHVEPADGGHIDWTNGYIVAKGIGRAERGSFDKQTELLAREAARKAALRNALALAQGIRIDASGTVGQLREGLVKVQGVVRGHEEVSAQWYPDRAPGEAEVVVRVPLWGAKGLSSIAVTDHMTHLQQARAPRKPLIVDQADVSDFVLVIDARGTDLATSLFPVVRDSTGATLYDVSTCATTTAGTAPPARFVESQMSFEQLRAAVESDGPTRFALVSYAGPNKDATAVTADPPADEPTSQPAEKSNRRARRRMAVRAADAGGEGKTQVVLTEEDVDLIRRSPEGASALRQAHVVIVVDSAAAATEGRLLFEPTGALVATHP